MNVAIIVAAGQGTRMYGDIPKQFRPLAGVPLVIHTLRRFEQSRTIDEIVVAVSAEQRKTFLDIAARYDLRKLKTAVIGGATRSESVWLALETFDPARTGIVAVHDGARPFVTPDEIDRVVTAAHATGAAILATAATDTIKEVAAGRIVRTLPRESLRHALTPQCFRYELLHQAYQQASAEDRRNATDDSSLVERLGVKVEVLEGDPRNIKITRAEDWARAEEILASQRSAGQQVTGLFPVT